MNPEKKKYRVIGAGTTPRRGRAAMTTWMRRVICIRNLAKTCHL